MANDYLTPNMSLVVPVVGTQIGPNWAIDINSSLTILDGHTHSPGSGVQITPTGININADLAFNSNNATLLRSARFAPQSTTLTNPADINCLNDVLGDLYFNDGFGNKIRITQSGSVAGSSGTITGLPSGTASAAYLSVSGTFQFQQATNVGANIDVASVIVRYPGSYPTPAGNAIVIEAPTSLSSLYSLVLPALPGSTSFLTLDTSGNIVGNVSTNGGITGSNIASTTITQNKLAARPAFSNTPASAGGIAIAGSTGAFSTSSLSPVNLPNCSCTLTTTGRPIFISLTASNIISQPDGQAYLFGQNAVVKLNEFSAGEINSFYINTYVSPAGISGIFFASAGTYTFYSNAFQLGAGSFSAQNVMIVAYEL